MSHSPFLNSGSTSSGSFVDRDPPGPGSFAERDPSSSPGSFVATSEAAVWFQIPPLGSNQEPLLIIQFPIRTVSEYLHPPREEVPPRDSSRELVKAFLCLVVVICWCVFYFS